MAPRAILHKLREKTRRTRSSLHTLPPLHIPDDGSTRIASKTPSPHRKPAAGHSPSSIRHHAHAPARARAPPVTHGAASSPGWCLVADASGSGTFLSARKPNQDAFGLITPFANAPGSLFAGVYDGHGAQGGAVARLTRDLMPAVVNESLANLSERAGPSFRRFLTPEERRRAYARILTVAFVHAERALYEPARELDHAFSGTTATCIWLEGAELFCAWAGDSRCILGRRRRSFAPLSSDNVEAIDLTWDQKPCRADEKKRVRAAGARVTRWQKNAGPQRVWLPDEWLPGLAMTRSIGDTILSKHGVTPRPEVTVTTLSSTESFVVAASDGVWEFMTSVEVAEFVAAQKEAGCSAEVASQRLVDEAVGRWQLHESIVDDTTAVVLYIDLPSESVEPPARKGSRLGLKRSDDVFEYENRSLRDLFKMRKAEISAQDRTDKPWKVAINGKLEHFEPHSDEDIRLAE